MSPPEGGVWDSISGATDVLTCVHMPDGLTVQVPVRRDQTAADLLSAACKVGLAASCGEMMTPQQLLHIPDSCCRKTKQNLSLSSGILHYPAIHTLCVTSCNVRLDHA